VQAIVLVGGEGTRLRPLTDNVPKPAITLVDRPFLAYMVEWLGSHGVSEVVLACGFLPDRLREALGDGEHEGVALTYVTEPERRGTAGAIRFAAEALGDRLEDRFFALNGDLLTELDLAALLRAHEQRRARATIGLHQVDDAAAFGLVACDEEGSVLAFTEKTGISEPGEVNAGAYVLERSVLDLIPSGRKVSIETEVFPRLVGKGLCALPLDGYWMDIGTHERYLQATWDILEGRVESEVRPTAPGLLLAASAVVADSARIGPRAVISPGCEVGADAEVTGSVLLDGATVGAGARVSGSVLAPGAVVEPGAQLVDTMVAENERVGAER
jgi:mannose-1-phosphate guanylyltransferase